MKRNIWWKIFRFSKLTVNLYQSKIYISLKYRRIYNVTGIFNMYPRKCHEMDKGTIQTLGNLPFSSRSITFNLQRRKKQDREPRTYFHNTNSSQQNHHRCSVVRIYVTTSLWWPISPLSMSVCLSMPLSMSECVPLYILCLTIPHWLWWNLPLQNFFFFSILKCLSVYLTFLSFSSNVHGCDNFFFNCGIHWVSITISQRCTGVTIQG